MPAVLEFERANANARSYIGSFDDPGEIRRTEVRSLQLPGVCACIVDNDLTYNDEPLGKLTPQTFPGSPRVASDKLLSWLIQEITTLYQEEELPNE